MSMNNIIPTGTTRERKSVPLFGKIISPLVPCRLRHLYATVSLLAVVTLLTPAPAQAQLARISDLPTVQALIDKGEAAVAANNLNLARRLYRQARQAGKPLSESYRDLGTAFRGLDEGIAAEMDRKYEQASLLLVTANFELARLYRRQNQPEVAVPLLVEVVKIMTPARELGRQAYEELRQLEFVSTPYAPAP
jgi:hypothetical protein